jgi:hypothetical protein
MPSSLPAPKRPQAFPGGPEGSRVRESKEGIVGAILMCGVKRVVEGIWKGLGWKEKYNCREYYV